jgi:hypothetical protein
MPFTSPLKANIVWSQARPLPSCVLHFSISFHIGPQQEVCRAIIRRHLPSPGVIGPIAYITK